MVSDLGAASSTTAVHQSPISATERMITSPQYFYFQLPSGSISDLGRITEEMRRRDTWHVSVLGVVSGTAMVHQHPISATEKTVTSA